jgi:hypothetical protein
MTQRKGPQKMRTAPMGLRTWRSRCAQVVADRGEQGAAQLGGLRSSLRLVRFGGQSLGPQGEQRLAGDPAQSVLLGGGQEPTGHSPTRVRTRRPGFAAPSPITRGWQL